MAKYLMLCRYTTKGLAEIAASPQRTDAARGLAEKLGVRLDAVYLALGRYDAVGIADAPDDDTMAAFCLALGQQGAVTTETLRLWEGADFEAILERLP